MSTGVSIFKHQRKRVCHTTDWSTESWPALVSDGPRREYFSDACPADSTSSTMATVTPMFREFGDVSTVISEQKGLWCDKAKIYFVGVSFRFSNTDGWYFGETHDAAFCWWWSLKLEKESVSRWGLASSTPGHVILAFDEYITYFLGSKMERNA